MATVLRVKRRLDDQPQDVLVLCKRAKLNNDGVNDEETACTSVPTIAKFAGTLEDPEEDIVRHLAAKLRYKELNAASRHSCKDVLARVHKEKTEKSAANRYKVVESLRKLDTSNVMEFKDKVFTFLDVEDSDSLALNQDVASTECTDCAYDVYYVETEKDDYVDDHISVLAMYEHEMVWDAYREEKSEDPYASEDSNSESNWRNDYPDTDMHSNRSIETSMQSDSLSSDEEDENFVYCLNENDVELHGYKYARYKQRMQKLFSDNEEEHEISNNEEEHEISDNEEEHEISNNEEEHEISDNEEEHEISDNDSDDGSPKLCTYR